MGVFCCRPVPHSLYDFEGAEICLIVKDHKGTMASLLLAMTEDVGCPYAGKSDSDTLL